MQFAHHQPRPGRKSRPAPAPEQVSHSSHHHPLDDIDFRPGPLKTSFRGISHEFAAGAATPKPIIQPKLTIGQPNDPYEQEADRIATQVVQHLHAPNSDHQGHPVPESPNQDQPSLNPVTLQPKPTADVSPRAIAASPDIETAIHQARSGGQPLPEHLRHPLEQSFGADFSRVKIHTDATAD